MNRKSLEKNKGMLFVFEKESAHSFWMRNTLIPLDIIWINRNREIIFITKNVQPCADNQCPSIKPDKPAKYVLEINAGISDKLGLTIGDKMEITLE